jgi:GNAT superfamily N-acetyltransferase
MEQIKVFQASFEHLEELSLLFDRYRVFYQASSDLEAAKKFLLERFQKNDSMIFVASNDDRIVGFTQLYPSFSSVSMKRVWILNDLFVEELSRQQGVAKLLISKAENFAKQTGAVRIILTTQVSNIAARSLYESLGYLKDRGFDRYTRQL